jgi:hypothetical protein
VVVFHTLNAFLLRNGADVSGAAAELHAAAAPYLGWAWRRCEGRP